MDDLNGPAEPVPNRLRILAAQENLGRLVSVHRPATWFSRLVFRASRIYLYDKGFVVDTPKGVTALFLWEQVTVTEQAGGWLVRKQDGGLFRISRRWTDYKELGRRLPSR